MHQVKKVIDEAIQDFKDEAAKKGITLTDDVAKSMVNEVWTNAKLPRGIMLNPRTKSEKLDLDLCLHFLLKSEAYY